MTQPALESTMSPQAVNQSSPSLRPPTTSTSLPARGGRGVLRPAAGTWQVQVKVKVQVQQGLASPSQSG